MLIGARCSIFLFILSDIVRFDAMLTEYKDDKKQGYGVSKFRDGEKYEGQWNEVIAKMIYDIVDRCGLW